jgi:radical SAM superfamily enzyme YgiQ (UPF0313 family)
MNNKVLLIEPLVDCDLEPQFLTVGNSLEPYALECLAGAAEAHGYCVDIVQQGEMTPEDIAMLVAKTAPFCVGFSVLTHTADRTKNIAKTIKTTVPNVTIIVGGQHPSLDLQYVEYEHFDYAVIGEGEVTFIELLDFLGKKCFSSPSDIPGIAYKDTVQKKIVITQPRSRLNNLDELPLPKRVHSFLEKARSWNLTYPSPNQQSAVAQIGYSRGCCYECTFCSSPVVWNKSHGITEALKRVTYRSAISVAKEVRNLHEKYGVNLLYFTDLTFNDNASKVRDLCQALIDEGLHEGSDLDADHLSHSVHWYALLRIGLDWETAKLMARAGCSKIGLGIESFDHKLLRKYNKLFVNSETVLSSLQASDAAGIINRCLLVFGSPEETPKTVANTIEFLKRLPIDQVRVAFLTPFPKTPLFEILFDKITTQDLALYDEEHPIIRCDSFSPEDLKKARLKIAWEFYGSEEYGERCRKKLHRFPWLEKSYKWFFDDLYARSKRQIDLSKIIETD